MHEILNGPLRSVCLDKPHSLLVLCGWCNCYEVTDKKKWPEARQLAVLKIRSPGDFDLAAHNMLANPNAPNRITQEEVSAWIPTIPT